MVSKLSNLSFETTDRNLWAPGAAIELGIDSGDLFIFDPEEITYDIDIGGSFLGFEAEVFLDTKFGLLAYAEIGEAGRFGGSIDIALNTEHDAIASASGAGINFDFSDYTIIRADIDSVGFGLGAKAGLDLVVGFEFGFRDIEYALFGIKGDSEEFKIIDIPEKRIPLFTVEPFETELPFDLGFGLELTLRVPTGANTEGTSAGSLVVDSEGVSDTSFIELTADVDELLLTLLQKIPFPPLAAIAKTLENTVFATFEFDIADYVSAIGENIFKVEATVLDIGASIGAAISEELTLDFGDNEGGATREADINIALRSDNGTPTDLSDDVVTTAKLGDANVNIAAPTFAGTAPILVDATFDVNRAQFSHSIGIDVVGSFTIDALSAKTSGVIGDKLDIEIGPLLSFEFPEGGFRLDLINDLYTNSFEVPGVDFTSQTETYEVFYSETLPFGIDVEKPGQVQELIAYNEARQINIAASSATFTDVINGRPEVLSYLTGSDGILDASDVSGTAEFALWIADRPFLHVDLENNLSEPERDILIIDVENIDPNIPLGALNATYDNTNGTTSYPTTGTLFASQATSSAGYEFLTNLPFQSQLDDPETGQNSSNFFGADTLTYRYGGFGNIQLGDLFLRTEISPNILGNDLDDLLVYWGDEARLIDGGDHVSGSATGDVLIANFAHSHPDDAIEWDLRAGAVGQSGKEVSLQLSRNDSKQRFEAENQTLVGYTESVSTPGIVENLTSGPATITSSVFATGGTFIVRVAAIDTENGASEFTLNVVDSIGNVVRVVEGGFSTNEKQPGGISTEQVLKGVFKNVVVNAGERIQVVGVSSSNTGPNADNALVDYFDVWEQHDISLRNIESFVIETSAQSDYIVTDTFRDLIILGQGDDTLVLTADEHAETMDLGLGADLAVIELADSAQVGSSGTVFDIVYGEPGADELIFRNISDSGTVWSLFSPDPANGDVMFPYTSPPLGFDAGSLDAFNYLRALDQLSNLSDFGLGSASLPQTTLNQFYIEAHTNDGNILGTRAAHVEAVSFEGSDTANDAAFYFGGAFYTGGDSNADFFAADFSKFAPPTGGGKGILINGFHDGGDPTLKSPFPDGPTTFEYNNGFTYANGVNDRTSFIDGFERFYVIATEFDDVLVGGAFADFFSAGDGDDILVGGGSDQSVVAETERLFGGLGADTFYVDGDQSAEIDGGSIFGNPAASATDRLIFGPGAVESQGIALTGLRHVIAQSGGGGDIAYGGTSTSSALLTALTDLDLAFGNRDLSFATDLNTGPVVELSDIEQTNLTGLDSTDDLFIYDGGATYIGGERANDSDTLLADFSDQTFGISYNVEQDFEGQALSNGLYISGIDRVVVKLGSGADTLVGGLLDDYIEGGAGSDTLRGGGAVGQDELFGNEGADFFAWNANDGVAIVDGGSDVGDTNNEVEDRIAVSAIDSDGLSLSQPGEGLGVRLLNTGGLFTTQQSAPVDANSFDTDIERLLTTINQADKFVVFSGANRIEYVNIEATDVQGSNEEDDLILFNGGIYYDGGDRDGDADVFVANLFNESADFEIRARSGNDRIDDDQVYSDIGNGTVIGNFERLFLELGNGEDFIVGGEFNDVINGRGGNDTIAGGLGDDNINGGLGNDLLLYSGGNDTIDGNSGIDTLEMGAIAGGYQRVLGFSGSFTVEFSFNILDLATSADVQNEFGQLYSTITSTNRIISGDLGGEFLEYSRIEKIVISAEDTDDLLLSGEMGGTLSGDGGDDVLAGRDGDDLLIGAGGFDRYVVNGNWGNDVIGGEHTGDGELFLLGWDRSEITFSLDASPNPDLNDLIITNTNGDTIRFVNYFTGGVNGLNYTFTFDDQSVKIDLSGLGATPLATPATGLTLIGTDGRDEFIAGTDGIDAYFAGDGNDLIVGSPGADIISGGIGVDAVIYEASPAVNPTDPGVIVDLASGFGMGGHADGDLLISIEDVLGSNASDTLLGDEKRNAIAGGRGDDTIDGRGGDDFLTGDAGNDDITGGDGNDTIFGGRGNDIIDAGDGNDYVHADKGDDDISAGMGNDIVIGGDGDDIADLGEGDDTYIFLMEEDGLLAAVGTDTVDGGLGSNTVELADFSAKATIQLGGSFGSPQTISSSGENDTNPPGTFVTIANLSNFQNVVGTAFDDVIFGDASDNKLAGSGGDDLLLGFQGNDTIIGGAGFDRISYAAEGGTTNVVVNLETGIATDSYGGTDTIAEVEHILGSNRSSGYDILIGDDGDNRFTGNKGTVIDEIYGGLGTDTVDYSAESDTQNYIPGTMTPSANGVGIVVDLSFAGSPTVPNATDTSGHGDYLVSIENVIGSIRDDDIGGDDQDNLFVGGDGDDILNGRAGIDTVDYSQEILGLNQGIVIFDIDPMLNRDTFGDVDTLLNIERIIGTDFNDAILRFSDQENTVFGGDGNDTLILHDQFGATAISGNQLFGQGGDDDLTGGSADDILSGGTGNDTTAGGLGNDRYLYTDGLDDFDGQGGNDEVDFSFFRSAIIADLSLTQILTTDMEDASVGIQRLLLNTSSVESVTGSDFADILSGSVGDNRISGGAGDDTISTGAGVDFIDGGAGFDTLTFGSGPNGVTVDLSFAGLNVTDSFGNSEGVSGVEQIFGTAFADNFTGGASNETFVGGDGADLFNGGDGIDTIDLSLETGTGTGNISVNVDLITGETTGTVIDTFGNTDTFTSIERFIGGNGSFDDIIGSTNDEIFTGGAGLNIDFIDGGGGIDTVDYSRETGSNRVIVNISGNGTIGSPNATDTFGHGDALANIENIIGTDANDEITGSSTANELSGGDGDDLLVGGDGIDNLDGGEGLDTVNYGAEIGGIGGVTVNLQMRSQQATDTFGNQETLVSIERILGTSFVDQLVGSIADEVLLGEAGADYLDGWEGNDTLNGGADIDTILGWDGNDNLFGEDGDDLLFGENGDDILNGGQGADTINGGDGSDTASYKGSNVAVMIDLSLGIVSGGHATGDTLSSIENATGSDHDDILNGDDKDNTLNGGLGDDMLNGGLGVDTADYSDAASGIRVFLADTNGQNTLGAGRDTHIGIENLIGSAFDDALYGDGGDNVLEGGDGNDRIVAGGGGDTLRGGAGNDILKGRAGDDMLFGDAGDDIMFADGGVDTLDGGADNDFLYGGSSNDILDGGTGDDRLRGNLNNDTLNGGEGFDLLFGGGQNDTLNGDEGDDNLRGENGNDILDGGAGDDVLFGNGLVGGTSGDADIFVFKTGNEIDRIRDWEDGSDMIDLTSYGFATAGDALAQFVQQGGNVRFIDGTDELVIEGELLANITAADILV